MTCSVEKILLTLLLTASYFILPKYGFAGGCQDLTAYDDLLSHFLYPLSHANIFHLGVNVVCLWMLPCKTYLYLTYPIAVVASFLPSPTLGTLLLGMEESPTMGFSGVLFAMVGISWGRVRRLRDMFVRNKWFLLITALIPNINFLIHLYCLMTGYLTGTICAKKSVTS